MIQNNETHRLTPSYLSLVLVMMMWGFNVFSCWADILGTKLQCCFTSTETIWTIRGRKPSTSTSTFTQFLSSDKRESSSSVLLYVHRDYTDY